MVKPMIRIGPKRLDAIEMLSVLRLSLVLGDDQMVIADIEERVRVLVTGTVDASWLGVGDHQKNEFSVPTTRDRKCHHLPVPLGDPEHDVSSGSSLATPARRLAVEHRLIHLDLTREGRKDDPPSLGLEWPLEGS